MHVYIEFKYIHISKYTHVQIHATCLQMYTYTVVAVVVALLVVVTVAVAEALAAGMAVVDAVVVTVAP